MPLAVDAVRDPVSPNPPRRRASGGAFDAVVPWLIGTIAACWLYFGRTILIPITLAIFLSFLLTPVVEAFRKARLPRIPAVIFGIFLALSGIGVTGAILISQASTLATDAPAYAERITEKAAGLRQDIESRLGILARETTAGGSGRQATERARARGEQQLSQRDSGGLVAVEVHEPPLTAIEEFRTVILPALAPVETALIVIIVTIFILFQKEDLRDRLLRLMGSGDLHRSTVALDDAAKRLSRYFLSQFVVNCGFGTIIWIGLFTLGVPSPGFWGILAGLLRFIPYVGSLVAALGPMALAAAIDPGWSLVTYVALLYLIVDLIIGYIIEPMLYGHSTGLSPVSVVIAAFFWTWIWGPLGLVLSMPLTLMLVVLGRHIPAFEFFDIILGDRPALSPAETFYQRVLADHADEAIEQAEEFLETRPLGSYYDEVVLPALRLAALDVDRGAVERSAMQTVCEGSLEVLVALADHQDSPAGGASARADAKNSLLFGRSVVCIAGLGPLDAAVTTMSMEMMRRAGCQVRELTRERLRTTESAVSEIGEADTICVLGLFDLRSAVRMRRIAQTVSDRLPGALIIVGVQRVAESLVSPSEDIVLPRSISELVSVLASAAKLPDQDVMEVEQA